MELGIDKTKVALTIVIMLVIFNIILLSVLAYKTLTQGNKNSEETVKKQEKELILFEDEML